MKKHLIWAFPDSPISIMFNDDFPCWAIQLTGPHLPVTVAVFDDAHDAIEWAEAIPYEWSETGRHKDFLS